MCNKMAFGTKSEADRQIKIMFNRQSKKVKSKAYECPDCGMWHLTTQTNKQKREKRRNLKRLKRDHYG